MGLWVSSNSQTFLIKVIGPNQSDLWNMKIKVCLSSFSVFSSSIVCNLEALEDRTIAPLGGRLLFLVQDVVKV